MNTVISVAHDKGGVGKTTISSNLLAFFSKQDGGVTAIDLDPKQHLSRFVARRDDVNIRLLSIGSAQELKSFLDNARGIIIIDIGGMDTDLTRFAIVYSDMIITPVADSQVEIDGLVDFIGVIKRLRELRSDFKATVLLNRIHPSSSKSVEELKAFVLDQDELELFDSVIRDRVAFKNAYAKAKSVMEFQKFGKADADMIAVILEMMEKLHGKV